LRPGSTSIIEVMRPQMRRLSVIAAMCAAFVVVPTSSYAQPPPKRRSSPPAAAAPAPAAPADAGVKKPAKTKVFDFTGIDINGQNRSPQLLYFLERANEELERASLEKRSFIPEMVRSIEEDTL
jgi:hypothetical protein